MQVARAKRAVHPALQGAWAPPASAPPLVLGVSSHTLTMQMKLLGRAYWSVGGAWSNTHLLGSVLIHC